MNRPATNRYLVKPDSDTEGFNGIALATEQDAQRYRSFTGTVIASPEKLYYAADEYHTYGTERPACLLREIRELTALTNLHDDAIIPAGSRVMFTYLSHNCPKVDEMLLVEHRQMIAFFGINNGYDGKRYFNYSSDEIFQTQSRRIDLKKEWRIISRPVISDIIIPVNNLLIVRLLEAEDKEKLYDDNDYSVGIVIHASNPVQEFFSRQAPDENVTVGKKVYFASKSMIRMEVDELNTLNRDGQSSLFRIHRQNVTAYADQ